MDELKGLVSFAFILIGISFAPQGFENSQSVVNPYIEIARINDAIGGAYDHQIDIFSPANFEAALDSLSRAETELEQDRDHKKIAYHLNLADAYLLKAKSVAGTAKRELPGVFCERENAIKSNASRYFPGEMLSLDRNLKKMTKIFEMDRDSLLDQVDQVNQADDDVRSNVKKLAHDYKNLELKSLYLVALGPADKKLSEAKMSGAKELTPEMLKLAQETFKRSRGVIALNRHNREMVEKASEEALLVATKLSNTVLAIRVAGMSLGAGGRDQSDGSKASSVAVFDGAE